MSEPDATPARALHPAFRAVRALLARQGDVSPTIHALFDDPGCAPFWEAAGNHLQAMVAKRRDARIDSWDGMSIEDSAAAEIVGALVVPVLFGHDAHGSFNRSIRAKVNMKRRAEAAVKARELAILLRDITREPMPPDGALSVLSLVPMPSRYAESIPSYFQTYPTADALDSLAAGLKIPPDYANAPGLASQKPTWRDWLREVNANLADLGFTLREYDAVALVVAMAAAEKMPPPSLDSVRDALRPLR